MAQPKLVTPPVLPVGNHEGVLAAKQGAVTCQQGFLCSMLAAQQPPALCSPVPVFEDAIFLCHADWEENRMDSGHPLDAQGHTWEVFTSCQRRLKIAAVA